MTIFADKLAGMVNPEHPHYLEINDLMLEPAVKVLKALEDLDGAEFTIDELEKAAGLGPLLSTEAARIAKFVMRCHSRGGEWVEKFNARVLSRTADEEAEANAAITRARNQVTQELAPTVEDSAAAKEAKAKVESLLK